MTKREIEELNDQLSRAKTDLYYAEEKLKNLEPDLKFYKRMLRVLLKFTERNYDTSEDYL